MGEQLPDESLVREFCRGDQSAFETIVARHGQCVSTLANRLLGWPGEVDDVTQEVFLTAYVNLKRFRGKSSLRTWLFTITINKCRTHLRHRMVRQTFLSGLGRQEHIKTPKLGPDSELLEAMSQSIRKLPARYREPIVLYYLEGLPILQISEMLKLSINAVHVRLNRARKRLKESLAPWEPSP